MEQMDSELCMQTTPQSSLPQLLQMQLVLLMQSALETFYQTTLKRQRRPVLQQQHKTSSSMAPTLQPTGSNSLLFPLQHPLAFPWEESLINSHP